MKNCKIIRDLIPLYADGEASEETEALVKQHIENCPSCYAYYRSCKRYPHPRVGNVAQAHYRYNEVIKKIEMDRLKKTVAVAAICAATAYVLKCADTKGKK